MNVDEIKIERKIRSILKGWMFEERKGINEVENKIYEVWLKE